MLVGSLIGSEIGDIGEGIGGLFGGGGDGEGGGIFGELGEGGAGGEYGAENGAVGDQIPYGGQQGPTALDWMGQDYMHGSTMSGTSYLQA